MLIFYRMYKLNNFFGLCEMYKKKNNIPFRSNLKIRCDRCYCLKNKNINVLIHDS